jgi:NitT/TauT family transport system substrate-binding protein
MISRRDFIGRLTVAGATGVLGLEASPAASEPPPETTKIRLLEYPPFAWAACESPAVVALELLQAEGFTVEWVGRSVYPTGRRAVDAGGVDFWWDFSGRLVTWVDGGAPLVIVTGVHVGCFDLFGSDRVRAVRDLKGKTVSVTQLQSGHHIFLSALLANVGLDPRKDVHFVEYPHDEAARLFAAGKLDAYLAFADDSQEIQARNLGHIILDTATDRPWSHYFCCMLGADPKFVRTNPVATKHVVRAWLKAADICAQEPVRAARLMVDGGRTKNYDYTLGTLKALPFAAWRQYDPEDTVRFYALRLREAGMVKSSPQKIIAQGTDWRFLRGLKKELKA